jgi:hypothetical protein
MAVSRGQSGHRTGGEIEADPRMVMAITAIILTAAVAVIVYMIISAAAV